MILKNKKVAVIGLGKSGFAAAKFLVSQKAHVRASDGSEKKEVLENAGYLRGVGVDVETGAHTEAFLKGAEVLITSPGVPKNSLPLEWARSKKIPVISEIELAAAFCKGKIVAVTGSNGKTTTCHLIHRLLVDAGKKSVLCGNVGFSFLDALPSIDSSTMVVLELSSFQLEDSPRFHPAVSVLLNLSPNHLDRHKTMENYIAAKKMIFKNQTSRDWLVVNADNEITREAAVEARCRVVLFSKSPLKSGIFLKKSEAVWKKDGKSTRLFVLKNLKLKGEHNFENMMAAAAVAKILGVKPASVQKTLESFETLEHRIEPVREIKGVRFVNDSKSTTLASTRAAIGAVDKGLILIAGGRDKGSDFTQIEPLVRERVKKCVLYGESRDKIKSAWKNVPEIYTEAEFRRAVLKAFEIASTGDTVLLSPMCTSFDQFNSFEHRGEVFKKIVQEL